MYLINRQLSIYICARQAFVLTLRHSSGTDISSHAAAFEVCQIVAGHYLYLVTGEVLQVGDDR